uniref:N/A n=1 Tax=Ganoderma boninense TaxID=34458 RepID=A0A5K1K7H9_9APHY|nr:N/A [Ganoderma boninense]
MQSGIEKEFKTKQTQEGYVNRAREKYEGDCVRINSYTAQSTLIQGRDLEKVHMKLERAQQTVQANQRDYANFARLLKDTMQKWEHGWKGFCDTCQDLEEERIEFMKDNMWAYANAVSTVCVSDDESCEKLRLALEQLEVERDMENFVRDYGTGNAIPDPLPSPTTQALTRSRHPLSATSPMQSQPDPEPEPPVDMTGVGASAQASPPQRTGAQSRSSTRAQEYGQQTNADPQADPIDPTAVTMLKVGQNAYEVDLARDPQANGVLSASSNAANPHVGQDDDPLQRQLNDLRNPAGGGSVRRSGQWKPTQSQSTPGGSGLSPPPGAAQRNRDYRNSAEIVVGSYPPPGQPATSRPTSPNITNVHMRPPSQNGLPGPTSTVSVQNVLADYQQSLPGERKSVSRPASRANSISLPQGSSIMDRPLSSESGQAGIGAQGRSTSPQPYLPLARSVSPAMQGPPASNRNSFTRPPATGPVAGAGHARSGSNVRQGSISVPSQPAHQQRPTSPGIGIQLDPSGRVVADDMAAIYPRPTPQHLPAQQQPPFGAPPPVPAAQQQVQRRPSINTGVNGAPYPGGPQYGRPGQAPAPVYGQPPQQQYAPPVQPPQQQQYGAPQVQPGGFQQGYQQQQQQQQQPVYGQPPPGGALVQRGPSVSGYFPQQPPQPQSQALQQQQQQQYRAPSPRAPSPQPPQGGQPPPTGQYTDDGRGVLFYVKAMYNYRATIDEEFDFQEGDIIAVTATPEDGWWSGELLDETRRQPGRHIFPSNFVCLF